MAARFPTARSVVMMISTHLKVGLEKVWFSLSRYLDRREEAENWGENARLPGDEKAPAAHFPVSLR